MISQCKPNRTIQFVNEFKQKETQDPNDNSQILGRDVFIFALFP